MSQKDNFYIGWQEQMSDSQWHFLRNRITLLFVGVLLLVGTVVWLQKPFNNHRFELGQVKEITGRYYAKPLPMLVADANTLPKGLSNQIVLVGFGKFGAEGIVADMEREHGALSGKKLRLAGTLIYGDNKTLFELTNEAASLLEIVEDVPVQAPPFQARLGQELQGEILDPKCYFGAMKPGEGKIHKSCAIRCISGGIPPVFRQKKSGKKSTYDYYLLLDKDGSKINNQILDYIAEPIQLTGETTAFMDWKVLYVDVSSIRIVE
ncbi:MAG: hypothetical protein ACPGXL_07000 [Chitinophagales bacterium]